MSDPDRSHFRRPMRLIARNADGSVKVGALSRFALRHPFEVALGSGLAIFGWSQGQAVSSTRGSAEWAAALVVAQLVAWFPRVGVARRYTERLLREQSASGSSDGAIAKLDP